MPERSSSSRRVLAVAVAIAALAGVLLLFASRFVLLELNLRRLGVALVAALITAAASTGAGAAAIALFERLVSGRHDREPVGVETALLVGFPIFGAVAFLVGLASTGPRAMLLPLLAGFAGLAWTHHGISSASLRSSVEKLPAWIALVLALCLLAALLLAQLPAVGLDDVAYHLTIPKQWALEGRAVAFPLMSHSWFPLGSESADLPNFALLGGNDAAYASHFVHLLIALAAGAFLLSWLRQAAPTLGAAAAVAILSTPALLLTAGWSGTDMPLLGICLVLSRTLAEPDLRQRGGIAAAAICGGLLVKYTFLPLGGTLVLAAIVTRADERKMIVRAATAGAAAGSVFLLRNLVMTGNPVTPFLTGEGSAVSGFRAGSSIAGTLSSYVYDGRLIDDTLGVALLALVVALPFAALVEDDTRRLRAGASMMFAVTLLLLFTAPAGRILVPFLTVTACAAVILLDDPAARSRVRTLRAFLGIAAIAQLCLVGAYLASLAPLEIARGRASEEEYLGTERGDNAAIGWCNERLGKNDRALVLGVQELFAFDVRARGGGNFDGPQLNRYLEAPDLAAKLRDDGITHLVVFEDRLRVGVAPTSVRDAQRELFLTSAASASLRALSGSGATEIARQGTLAIYELKD